MVCSVLCDGSEAGVSWELLGGLCSSISEIEAALLNLGAGLGIDKGAARGELFAAAEINRLASAFGSFGRGALSPSA